MVAPEAFAGMRQYFGDTGRKYQYPGGKKDI